MPIAPPLLRFVEDELARSSALIERVRVAALELLHNAKSGGALSPAELRQRPELSQALRQHASAYTGRFTLALRECVMADLASHDAPAHDGASQPPPTDTLALMDEAQVESDIEVARATMLIDSVVEWEQRELQTFTSALRGETHVSSDSNPLRAALVTQALWQSVSALPVQPESRALLLQLSAKLFAPLLKTAYAAACTRIEAQGVEPSLYRTQVLAAGTPGDAAQPQQRAVSYDVTRPGALEALLSGMPGTRGGEAAGARHGLDAQIVELLSRLFDAILADPLLPASAGAAIARLQVPTLRMALRDPRLLDAHDHPTWRLLDRIASAGHQAAAAPRRLTDLPAFCDRLADDLARHAAPDVELYRQALAQLDGHLLARLRAAQKAAQPSIDALLRTARRMQIQSHVQERMKEQFAAAPVSATVQRFLLHHWAKLLAETILQSGAESEASIACTRTVDDLLWSLNTPNHPASRQRLLKLVPRLLDRLREGMAAAGVPQGEREALLGELEMSHTEALWPGTGPAALSASPHETPEQIVQRLREEVIAEAQPRNAFGDSVLDLSTLDTVPAGLMPDDEAGTTFSRDVADPARRARAAVDALEPGRWARLLLHGRWVDAQVLWCSEGGELLLFADADGRAHAMTRRAVERLHTEGLVKPFDSGSLIQRAVDSLLAGLPAAQ